MHILMTADTLGGVWNYARELVTGLSKRGVRITLVSFGEIPSVEQTAWMEGLSNFDYHPTGFKLEWMRDSADDLAQSSGYLQHLIDEVQPDVLHFNQYFYGALDLAVPKIVCAHSDVIGWWQAVRGCDPPSSTWIDEYRQLVYAGLEGADVIVAPSRWMLGSITENYLEPSDGRVIYNGRTPTLFNPHVSKDDMVMSVGRVWDAGKQVTLLAQQDLPCETFIVGSAQDPGSDSQLSFLEAGERKVNIQFKGIQSELQLRQMYGRCSIYAATSRYEPFGLAPLEAALSRCALVANDIPSLREIWGDSAMYFKANDGRSLGVAIRSLLADTDLRREYANRALRHAQENYSAPRMADDYLNLYRTQINAEVLAA
jgi:glycosyltransferase involved in cell wall biosynthesis